MIDRGKLSSAQRSALARRILVYLRGFDPPMTEAEFGRNIGVARQTVHNWMWNKGSPAESHITRLAEKLGITEEILRADIEASRGWRKPIKFAQFLAQVEAQAKRDNWPDVEKILPMLRYIVAENWQEKEGDAVEAAEAIILDDYPLRTKAAWVALIARGQQASGDE